MASTAEFAASPVVLFGGRHTTPGTGSFTPTIDYGDLKMVLQFLLLRYTELWQS